MSLQVVSEPTTRRVPELTIDKMKTDVMGILSTQSKTKETEQMMVEIKRQLDLIKGVKYTQDKYGNLYAVKGKLKDGLKYPAFVSHTDTVHMMRDTFSVGRTTKGNYFAFTEDNGEFKQVGVGGDDKCGIIACIELLHRRAYVKCAFFLDEEQGCLGSKEADLSFFDDCRYAIQIDRKGNGDVITTGSGTVLCSDEFKNLLNEIGKTYNYSSTTGMNTDVVQLKTRGLKISACNLSAGYYNPHSAQEYINEADLLNCIEFCLAIAKVSTVYPHTYVPAPPTYNKTNYGSGYNGYTSSHWEQHNKRVVKTIAIEDRKCPTCQTKLAHDEGLLCSACTREQLFIELQKDGTIKDIVAVAKKPEVDAIELPSTICIFCKSDMLASDENDRGFCFGCGKCQFCGDQVDTIEEAANSLCHNHNAYKIQCESCGDDIEHNLHYLNECFTCLQYMGRDIDRDTPSVEICLGDTCMNQLISAVDIDYQLCEKCRRTHRCATCKEPLKGALEVKENVCDACTTMYGM